MVGALFTLGGIGAYLVLGSGAPRPLPLAIGAGL